MSLGRFNDLFYAKVMCTSCKSSVYTPQSKGLLIFSVVWELTTCGDKTFTSLKKSQTKNNCMCMCFCMWCMFTSLYPKCSQPVNCNLSSHHHHRLLWIFLVRNHRIVMSSKELMTLSGVHPMTHSFCSSSAEIAVEDVWNWVFFLLLLLMLLLCSLCR